MSKGGEGEGEINGEIGAGRRRGRKGGGEGENRETRGDGDMGGGKRGGEEEIVRKGRGGKGAKGEGKRV